MPAWSGPRSTPRDPAYDASVTNTLTPTSTTADLQTRLKAYVAWVQGNLSGDEKGEAQLYLERLFQAFGHDGVREAGATFEDRIKKEHGGVVFADLMWKPNVLIEMKKRGSSLARHYRQIFDYWTRAVPARPRYAVLCNFDEFWIYDFDHQVDAPMDRVKLEDLPHRWEALAFLLPDNPAPRFENDLVEVTRVAASKVAKLFSALKARGIDTSEAQRFVLQSVMAMFAEDIGLLPRHSFSEALDAAANGESTYDLLGGLFREMNTPGTTAGGRFKDTPYFNGGLFSEIAAVDLTGDEVELLRDAARENWSGVRPEIFGTLFEGSMDADERHATGAHFTSPAQIAMVVTPVIVEPWQARLDAANRIDELEKVIYDMSQFQVLDPACGSGNFLYVAYRELRRLEHEAMERIRERRRSQNIAGQAAFSQITLEQFHGLDINGFAVEIAKLTLQLAKKLASDELGESENVLPLDNLGGSIFQADALFTPWPKADAIIGNPPFIGQRRMQEELGYDYCRALDAKFGPRGVADFVTYWFPLAHDALPEGGRAGFVATKSVKQGDGRKASLNYIVDNGGSIFNAIAAVPWAGAANVTVAIVNWIKATGMDVPMRHLIVDTDVEPLMVREIQSDLTADLDLRVARDLSSTRVGVYQGVTAGNMDAFRVSPAQARTWLEANPEAQNVLFPFLGGNALLKQTSVENWLVDVADQDASDAWHSYPQIMRHLEKTALPVATAKAETERLAGRAGPRTRYLDSWWMLWRRRMELLTALTGLNRYIAICRVAADARKPVFAFIDGSIRVDDGTVAFPMNDDYSLGILQSNLHERWFRARCSSLETRPRYTSRAVFETFPWPQDPDLVKAQAVADLAALINEERQSAFERGRPLATQYDVLRKPGKSRLRELHEDLDRAVLALYDFDPEVDLLAQLLALNHAVSIAEMRNETVTRPGPPKGVESRSTWAFPSPRFSA